jgi:hypothetical protein
MANQDEFLIKESLKYNINTFEIWCYEHDLVLSNNYDENLESQFLMKLKEVIIQKSSANFGVDQYENGKISNFHQKAMDEFRISYGDVEKQFENAHFFDAETNNYSFHDSIIITKNDSNFDYWFALFLRQYDQNIFEIQNFLEYQLLSNFNNNQTEFASFLKLCLRQYSEILSTKVFQTAQEWLDQKVVVNTIITRNSNKGVETNFLPKHSFKLKDVDDFKKYFEKKAYDFSEIINELRKDFVHESTRVQQLKDILSGIEIDPKNRIEWKGSFKELNLFVTFLNYDLKKIQPIKNGIWETTCVCFTKNGNDIKEVQISNANGSVRKKNLLFEIVAKL